MSVIYEYKRQQQGMRYLYRFDTSGGKLKLTYDQPTGDNTQELNTSTSALAIPAIKAIVDYFAQEFDVNAATTAFNLNSVKLNPASNSWVIFSR